MQKKFLLSNVLAVFLLIIGLTACHNPSKKTPLPNERELSSQHVPTPLPIFPDQEDDEPSLPDVTPAPPDQTAEPNLWDVSDVDVSKIDPNRKLIAFTFDDAPTRYLENILAIYADFNENNPDCTATATLFLNGCRFDEQTPTLLAAALSLGFELGNHTYSHADLTTLTLAETTAEIDRVDDFLFAIDGKKRHLFRPPFGKITNEQKNALATPIINWTIDTRDWTDIDEETVYQSVMQNKFPGAIVLMHDGHKNTLQALKRLLPDLKTAGYQVVGVSQMSKAHACNLYKGKEYIRARKQ